ncbi:MAG: HAMP domain-containing protein [Candidatus Methylomirabilales bacterium]
MLTAALPASVARRLSLGLGVILLALLLGLAVSLLFTRHVLEGYEVVARENAHFLALDEVEATFHRMLVQLMRVGRTSDERILTDLAALRDQFDAALARFESLHPEHGDNLLRPPGLSALRTLRDLRGQLASITSELLRTDRPLQWEHVERLNQIAIASHQAAAELELEHRTLIGGYVAAGRRGLGILTAVSVLCFLASVTLLAIGGAALRRRVIVPLRRVAETALTLAEGRLEARVPVSFQDEVGQVSRAFNTMADRLQVRERELRSAQGELEQRVRVTQALYQIGMQVAALDKLEPILQLVTQKARELLRVDVAAICLCADCKGERILRAFSGPPEAIRPTRLPAPCCGGAGACDAAGECSVLQPAFLAAHVKVPLRRDGQRNGFLCAGDRRARTFTPSELDLLTALATQAAIAFDKAALQDELRSLAAVQERERIAREMHDGLAQMVSLLHLKLQQVGLTGDRSAARQGLGEAIRLAEQAYDEVRQAIFGLRLKLAGGLVPTLREYLQDFSLQTGIQTDLKVEREPILLSPLSEVQLVRIAQEALANVRKHAQATRALLRLGADGDRVRLVIEDDGRGFDLAALETSAGRGFGLQSMRERAEGLGGHLTIAVAPGKGTRVAAILPSGRA